MPTNEQETDRSDRLIKENSEALRAVAEAITTHNQIIGRTEEALTALKEAVTTPPARRRRWFRW